MDSMSPVYLMTELSPSALTHSAYKSSCNQGRKELNVPCNLLNALNHMTDGGHKDSLGKD
jgi:hypothetical protein